MSAIMSLAAAHYTMMANNAAYSMMGANHARMGLLGTASQMACSNPTFGSLAALAEADTQLELQALTNSLQYKMAKAMLEQIKKQQKEDAERFNVLA